MQTVNFKKFLCLCIIVGIGAFGLSRYQNTSAKRMDDKYNGYVEKVHSSVDQDNDGVDD